MVMGPGNSLALQNYMIGAHFARAACQWLERSPVSMLVKIVVSHSAA
jgi:hypothetical protein